MWTEGNWHFIQKFILILPFLNYFHKILFRDPVIVPDFASDLNLSLISMSCSEYRKNWCNVNLSPTENSWMLQPLDKVSLGYFAPDRTIPSLLIWLSKATPDFLELPRALSLRSDGVLCVGRACIRRRGTNPINLVRGIGEAGQTPKWFIRRRRPTELVPSSTRSRVGTHQSGTQYPRDALFKGRKIQEFLVGDTSVGGNLASKNSGISTVFYGLVRIVH
jgi:hypothetical protein